jgi:probable HAF family extracellular repeat protein
MKCAKLVFIVVITLFAALTIPLRLAAQNEQTQKLHHYTVTDLGTLGGTSSYAVAINNKGWAGGAANLPGDTAQHAVVWRKGLKIDLGTFGGPNSALFGKGINERGQAVGEAEISTPDPLGQDFCGFGTHLICLPFVWQHGVKTQLPTLGGYNGNTYDINHRGQIAGQAQNTLLDPTCTFPSQQTPPVFWENGQVQQLPTFPGDTVGTAIEINDQGQAVGESGDCTNYNHHALLWQNGTVTDLGNLGGSVDNAAFGINNRGQIVGQAALPGNAGTDAFLWQNGVMTDLGALPGDVGSSAAGINNKGQVDGTSCDINGNCRAFLWQNGTMTDLNALVPPGSPLYLVFAYDINSEGQIAGQALEISTGQFHAFLATPCDEDHSGVEGCDYSMVDTPAVSRVSSPPPTQHPAVLIPGSRIPAGMLKRFHSRWSQRNPGSGTGSASNQKQEPQTITNDWEADHTLPPRWCGPNCQPHYGYCEVDSTTGKLTGSCVGRVFPLLACLHPSPDCIRGKKAIHVTITQCGEGPPERIDLARKCAFR